MKDTTTTTQLRHQFVRGLKPTAVNAEKLSLQKHVGCQTNLRDSTKRISNKSSCTQSWYINWCADCRDGNYCGTVGVTYVRYV